MIRVKLMSILVNDQNRARRFYRDVLGFGIKHEAKGVAFRAEPKAMGPTKYADFDDTCGNLIRLVEG